MMPRREGSRALVLCSATNDDGGLDSQARIALLATCAVRVCALMSMPAFRTSSVHCKASFSAGPGDEAGSTAVHLPGGLSLTPGPPTMLNRSTSTQPQCILAAGGARHFFSMAAFNVLILRVFILRKRVAVMAYCNAPRHMLDFVITSVVPLLHSCLHLHPAR